MGHDAGMPGNIVPLFQVESCNPGLIDGIRPLPSSSCMRIA
jgi:hypothetical protein